MRRMQMSYTMAMTRERLYWMGGFYSFLAVAALGARRKLGAVPEAMKGPLVVMPWVMAYQADLAYGNKSNRINDMALEIANDPSYWFVPVYPSHLQEIPSPLLQKPKSPSE